MSVLVRNFKVGFIGAGNMAQAITSAFIHSGLLPAEQIWISNRTPGKLQKVKEKWGVHTVENNEEIIDACDIVIIAVKPQDLAQAVENISSSFRENQIVVSLAAGISLASLKKLLPGAKRHVRVMTNTPARVRKATVGYCLSDQEDEGLSALVEDLFAPLGLVVQLDEGEEFEAFTVASGAGVGFIFELMQYWQEWLEERGLSGELAKAITVETFVGTAALAEQSEGVSLADLQRQVTSKKGVTAAGLDSMRELEAERALRYSFEKAAMRDRELGQD